jgi:NADP-dependent 3-hydroxy acid dehydrogenase YdfG
MAKFYHKVLLIGATSGIGESLASKFVEGGTKVIVTGRRMERLDAFVERYPGRSYTIRQDITDLETIPGFVDEFVLCCNFVIL